MPHLSSNPEADGIEEISRSPEEDVLELGYSQLDTCVADGRREGRGGWYRVDGWAGGWCRVVEVGTGWWVGEGIRELNLLNMCHQHLPTIFPYRLGRAEERELCADSERVGIVHALRVEDDLVRVGVVEDEALT